MSEERIKAIEDKLADIVNHGGASIRLEDPRVSSLFKLLSTVFATVITALMIWVASSINRLNETMSRVVTQNESIMATQADHSDRIKQLERRNGP